jgi:hypothetical protein
VDRPDQGLGEAGLLEGLPDPLPDQGREACRLEHDAVAGHQRDRDLAERDRPGVIPRRNHPDHADRLEGELRALRLQDRRHRELLVGENVRPVVRDPLERVDGGEDLHRVALDPRLALLIGEQLSDLVEVLEQHVAGAAQVAGPVLQREGGPERLNSRDLVDDALHLGGGQGPDGADQLAGRRIEGLERGLRGAALRGRLRAL